MRVVDELLEDEDLLEAVYEAQGKRHPHSRTRERGQTPAEVTLRMVLQEVEALPPRRGRKVRQLSERLETMAERVRRVVRQPRARVFEGLTQSPGKLLSLFESHTEMIRKGKAGKPNEFGKLVQLQEAELGRAPRWLAADAGYYSRANDEGAQALGVKYVFNSQSQCPQRATALCEKQRWLKRSQKCRISVLKRRDGLTRCHYHGFDGMRRWVGLGIIADNLVNLDAG